MAKENECLSETPAKRPRIVKVLTLSNICVAIAIVLFTISALVISNTIRNGAKYAQLAYDNAKNVAATDAYNKFYNSAYVSAERKYHVANRVSIDVASAKKEAKLEVLGVNDVEYVIENKSDNDDNLETWVEFYGTGVYTVDMRESEFIVDTNRQYILVRVPRPEFARCSIQKTETLFWKNGVFNKSYSDGVDHAQKLRAEGWTKLNNGMKSNTRFMKAAKDSATKVISDLVKGFNSELTDLVVEVEFVD
jgi:hypothetical protein